MPNGDIQKNILKIPYGLYLFLYITLILTLILTPYLISNRRTVSRFIKRLRLGAEEKAKEPEAAQDTDSKMENTSTCVDG